MRSKLLIFIITWSSVNSFFLIWVCCIFLNKHDSTEIWNILSFRPVACYVSSDQRSALLNLSLLLYNICCHSSKLQSFFVSGFRSNLYDENFTKTTVCLQDIRNAYIKAFKFLSTYLQHLLCKCELTSPLLKVAELRALPCVHVGQRCKWLFDTHHMFGVDRRWKRNLTGVIVTSDFTELFHFHNSRRDNDSPSLSVSPLISQMPQCRQNLLQWQLKIKHYLE